MVQDNLAESLMALWTLVERLRGPGGCPWDAKQTPASIKTYVLEEAYEVVDAIERESPREVRDELGDLLFQILFAASLYKDRGDFDLREVVETIREKMIRRHPHVFGPVEVHGPDEVAANWEKIKKRELGLSENDRWPLEKIPENLPALLRTFRLIERAVKHGLIRVEEEEGGQLQGRWGELGEAISQGDGAQVGRAIGEALFSLAALARKWGLQAEDLLREKNRRFIEETRRERG